MVKWVWWAHVLCHMWAQFAELNCDCVLWFVFANSADSISGSQLLSEAFEISNIYRTSTFAHEAVSSTMQSNMKIWECVMIRQLQLVVLFLGIFIPIFLLVNNVQLVSLVELSIYSLKLLFCVFNSHCKYVTPDIMLWEVSDSFSKRVLCQKKDALMTDLLLWASAPVQVRPWETSKTKSQNKGALRALLELLDKIYITLFQQLVRCPNMTEQWAGPFSHQIMNW